MQEICAFVGLDVHKETISVAVADAGRAGDAIALARLHRAGELTYVWVPDALHEALRDLVRARHAACHIRRLWSSALELAFRPALDVLRGEKCLH